MRWVVCGLAALLSAAGVRAEKPPVTIEAITAAHGPRAGFGTVVWAPDGRHFACLEGGSIEEYDVAAGLKKTLVSMRTLEDKAVPPPVPARFGWQNRGIREQTIQYSSSGKEILILARGDLFLLHRDTGAWDQLTADAEAERDPKLAPDGSAVAFRLGHDLYKLDIQSRKLTRLTVDGSATLLNGETDWVYPEELGVSTAYWWSPDGSSLAFLQFDVSREPYYPHVNLTEVMARLEPQRFPQPGTPNAEVRLGVVAASGGPVRWMELGDTRDHLLARVYWAPDSRTLAAERLNRVQNRLDLKFADAVTGAARVALHEEDPYWINVNDCFRFVHGGSEFLWGSERDGFLHLYLYSRDGKLLRQITRGEWEVTGVERVDEHADEIYYVSTEASPLERQLYRIRMDGSQKTRLSTGAGTHTISMGREYYLDSYSSLTQAPRRGLYRNDGRELRVYAETPAPEYQLLPTGILPVKSSDGAVMYARMIKPSGFTAGVKYSVIVMVYGGPHAQSVRDAWTGASIDQYLAQRGFLIWQLDNRGSAGRGHQWEAKVFRNLGAQELKDQEEGLRYLGGLGFADMSRVGIHGWSYGGYMTLYALTNAPDLFRAGAAGAPVTDWRDYDSIYTERYMGLPEENPEGYERSSPLAHAGALKARLLIAHNMEDDNVHFQNSFRMAEALEKAGKQFRMVVYPQRTHPVTGPFQRQWLETLAGFFEDALRTRRRAEDAGRGGGSAGQKSERMIASSARSGQAEQQTGGRARGSRELPRPGVAHSFGLAGALGSLPGVLRGHQGQALEGRGAVPQLSRLVGHALFEFARTDRRRRNPRAFLGDQHAATVRR